MSRHAQATEAATTVYAKSMLQYAREELRVADAKAATMFTVVGAAVGIAAAVAAFSWTPPSLNWPAGVISGIAIVNVAASVVLAGAAVYPRTGPGVERAPGRVAYFGDAARCGDSATLRGALETSVSDELTLLIEELFAVSRIAELKYRLIAISLWSLLAAATSACLAAGLEAIL